jgi:hypothetical protein
MCWATSVAKIRRSKDFLAFSAPGEEQHRERIGLLAGGAARNPHAVRRVRFALSHQWREHLFVQDAPRFGIAEEAADVDGEIPRQRVHLLGIGAQPLQVLA